VRKGSRQPASPKPRNETKLSDERPSPGRGFSVRSPLRNRRRILKTAELVARDIILDISERGMKAGDLLPPEHSMLKQYEVGRASLREALRLLEVQGLVQIRAGATGGPVVGSATSENLARMLTLFFGLAGATYGELTEVMLILYPQIAAVAASSKLNRADVALLNASIEHACGEPNPRMVRSESLRDFHSLLPALSKNIVWTLLADAVGLIFADHIMTTTDSRGFHAVSISDHKAIADAILASDPAAAREQMLEHTKRLIAFYKAQTPAIFSQLIEWR
jgi:GntR family transcriptional regulator, transcriptional repressor for pyruvate dehydrogenase complex